MYCHLDDPFSDLHGLHDLCHYHVDHDPSCQNHDCCLCQRPVCHRPCFHAICRGFCSFLVSCCHQLLAQHAPDHYAACRFVHSLYHHLHPPYECHLFYRLCHPALFASYHVCRHVWLAPHDHDHGLRFFHHVDRDHYHDRVWLAPHGRDPGLHAFHRADHDHDRDHHVWLALHDHDRGLHDFRRADLDHDRDHHAWPAPHGHDRGPRASHHADHDHVPHAFHHADHDHARGHHVSRLADHDRGR
mmetsp:Transcript_103470/g.161295  ORF Transcript_103470/g.161295 Transcript_103470/m.161295 type:complete len:244 (+) Transcript_103470:289-1020(+)